MGYKAFATMNVAIIGNEKMTGVLAQGLALAGHEIFIGIKENQSILLDFLATEFDNLSVSTIEEAATIADIVIMATAPEDVREAAYLLNDVRRKVIIDLSFMNFSRTANYLNTLNAIKAITGSPYIVKGFSASGFELAAFPVKDDSEINMFIVGDNKKAKEMVKLLARDLGYASCHDFGGSESVALIDEMAICHHHLSLRQQKGEKISIRILKN